MFITLWTITSCPPHQMVPAHQGTLNVESRVFEYYVVAYQGNAAVQKCKLSLAYDSQVWACRS